MTKTIRVAIVGGTGYTGIELIRLLLTHPNVELNWVTSRRLVGKPLAELFPSLLGQTDLTFSDIGKLSDKQISQCDVIFFSTPHGVAMESAARILKLGVRMIDLGADFRIKDDVLWSKYYGLKHTEKKWLTQAVYGLPELNRAQIKKGQLIANPGCYPTAVSLALAPLLNKNHINSINVKNIIADCKSGVSGAGRKEEISILLCEVSESIKAYGVANHRHLPEIEQTLTNIAGQTINLTFVPHLVPMKRGILATIYLDCDQDITTLQQLFKQHYDKSPFVHILPIGQYPQTRALTSSNHCQIALEKTAGGKLVILSAIDNLVKGAAGQAIQNMNLLFDFDETTGLKQIATVV